MRFRKRAAEHSEILAVDINKTAIDCAASGNHAVAGDLLVSHAEICAIMRYIRVEFFEAAFIKQDIKAFAGGETALGVLRIDTLLSPTEF